jgi:tripartite-type tricarboxylate transporter receptor subunit TctC
MAVTFSALARADYPTKPVTLVSPYGPGGAADLAARTLSAAAPPYLGKNIVVVNRTGAAGVTGSAFVAKNKPNGYTLLLARVGCQAAVPALNRRIPYKWDDFTFLGLLELNPFILTVNPKSPYQTLDQLKEALHSEKRLSYSSAGVGTLLHLGMVVLLDELGVDPAKVRHIPYKGGGKAGAAVVGGHVDIFFQNMSGVISHIKGGKLRALATTTKERVPALPDVPTFTELGYPKMEVIIGWSALYGPKNLPTEVVDKWGGVLGSLKEDKNWLKMTQDLGSVAMIRNPEDTKAFVKTQYEVFKEVTERLGLTIK